MCVCGGGGGCGGGVGDGCLTNESVDDTLQIPLRHKL